MSKIIGGLIEAIMQWSSQTHEITRVLQYLGYADHITIRMESRIPQRFIDELLKVGDRYFGEFVENSKPAYMGFNRQFFYNEDGSVSKKKVTQLLKILSKKSAAQYAGINNFFLDLDDNGIRGSFDFPGQLHDLLYLLKCGLVRLRDVTLTKIDTNVPFSIIEASSGEQSVVISIFCTTKA